MKDGTAAKRRRPSSEWKTVDVPDLRIIPDVLWQAVHDRLARTTAYYLRQQDGRLWGRPESGLEGRYLLSGLATCGLCGGAMCTLKRRGETKTYYYFMCTNYHLRGPQVCPNAQSIRVELVDREILRIVVEEVFTADAIETAVREAVQRQASPPDQAKAKREGLEKELRKVEAELDRLVRAVADGQGAPAIVMAEIKARERRQAELKDQLEALEGMAKVVDMEPGKLAKSLREEARLTDWREILKRNAPQARQILRSILGTRVEFSPIPEGYEYTLYVSFDKFLEGVIGFNTGCAGRGSRTPTGARPTRF